MIERLWVAATVGMLALLGCGQQAEPDAGLGDFDAGLGDVDAGADLDQGPCFPQPQPPTFCCDAPDEVELTCEPSFEDDAIGCPGDSSSPVPFGQLDAEATYPVGCVARFGACIRAFPGQVLTCTCEDSGGGVLWVCPR